MFWQEAPSVPGPAFMQANALALSGQHVCADEHSQGSWLQGVAAAEPPLLLEQAVVTRARRRRTMTAKRMLPRTSARDRCS